MSNWKNVNNWHWVNKNCINWAQKYFAEQLVGLEASQDGHQVKITKVVECTGDVDLNQRKGKIITIYDVVLRLNWEGSLADGTAVSGNLVIPEVAHDSSESDYVFQITVHDDSSEKLPVKTLIRQHLTPLLCKKFTTFPLDMIEAHRADVYIETPNLGAAGTTA